MNVQLKKFNPKTIADNRVCVFIGKRNTGKTVLLTDLLYHKRNIPVGVVMSGTEDGNSYYQQYVPDLFVYSEYKSDVTEKIIQRQKSLAKANTDTKQSGVFMLIDDCMYDKKMIREKNMRAIFMNGRHWNIMFMLSMQYCMDLPPDLRSNIDYIFVLRENIIQNQEKIYKNFFGIFPHFSIFQDVMNCCTEGYDCLVLDNTSKSNKIQDCVFWYRAKPDRKFKIGSKELWDYSNKNSSKTKEEPELDTKKFKKKNTPTVTVKKLKK